MDDPEIARRDGTERGGTGAERKRAPAIACVYLTSLIIELPLARSCFLSIRLDDCGDTFERARTLPVQFIRGDSCGNSACLRTALTNEFRFPLDTRVDTPRENVITSVIEILFSLDTMANREWSPMLIDFTRLSEVPH